MRFIPLPFILLSADPERLLLNGHRLELGDEKEPGNPAEDSRLFFFLSVC